MKIIFALITTLLLHSHQSTVKLATHEPAHPPRGPHASTSPTPTASEPPTAKREVPRFVPLIERFTRAGGASAANEEYIKKLKGHPAFAITIILLIGLFALTKILPSLLSAGNTNAQMHQLMETVRASIETQNKLLARIEHIEKTHANPAQLVSSVTMPETKPHSTASVEARRSSTQDLHEIRDAVVNLMRDMSTMKNSLHARDPRFNKRSQVFSLDNAGNANDDAFSTHHKDKAPEVAEALKSRQHASPTQQVINVCKPMNQQRVPSVSVSPEKQVSMSPSKRFSIPHPRARVRAKPMKIVEECEDMPDTNVVDVSKGARYPMQIIDVPVERPEERTDVDDAHNVVAEDDNPFAVIQKHGRHTLSPRLTAPRNLQFAHQSSVCGITHTPSTPERKRFSHAMSLGWTM